MWTLSDLSVCIWKLKSLPCKSICEGTFYLVILTVSFQLFQEVGVLCISSLIVFQHYPKTELRVSSNLVNIRTCADSCLMLIDLIKYVAADGDLFPPATEVQLEEQIPAEPESLVSFILHRCIYQSFYQAFLDNIYR